MEESERVLLQRLVHQGDTEAFAAIMDQYAGMVYGIGRRVLGNEDQAADVSQETFFDFLKSAHRITGSVGSWLHNPAPVAMSAPQYSASSKPSATSGVAFEVRSGFQGSASFGMSGGSYGGPAAYGGMPVNSPGLTPPNRRSGYAPPSYAPYGTGVSGGGFAFGGQGSAQLSPGNWPTNPGDNFTGGMPSVSISSGFTGQISGGPGTYLVATNYGFSRITTYSNGVVNDSLNSFSSSIPARSSAGGP
jgi:hypothetical protein